MLPRHTPTSNGSGGKGPPFKGLPPDEPEIPRNRSERRFSEAFDWIVGPNSFQYAHHLGHNTDGKLRAWIKGRNIPHDFLEQVTLIGIDPEKLQNLSDEDWQKYLMKFPGGLLPKPPVVRSFGFLRTEEVLQMLRSGEKS